MIRLLLPLVMGISCIAAVPASGAATDNRALNEYIKLLKDSAKDGADLARKLLGSAKTVDDPKFKVALYEKAYEFGIKKPAGYATAVQALEALLEAAPDRKKDWTIRLLALARRLRSLRTTSPEVKQTGGDIIALLVSLGDEGLSQGDATHAVMLYTESMSVARRMKSPLLGDIGQKLKRAAASKLMRQRAELLGDKLRKNAKDIATRRNLIRLYVVEMDKPAEAAKLLDPSVDEAWRTYVPLAAKDVTELAEAPCLELANWYKQHARTATPHGKPSMLLRAHAYFGQYLQLHRKKDAPFLVAQARLKAIGKELEKLQIDPISVAGVHKSGKLPVGANAGNEWIVLSWAAPRTGRADIWLFSPDGSKRVNITKDPRSTDIQPKFSPDARHIVFCRRSGIQERNGIYVCDANGGNLRKLAAPKEKETIRSPVWVSNSMVYFAYWVYDRRLGKGVNEIWCASLDGSIKRRVFVSRDAVKQGEVIVTDVSPSRKALLAVCQGGGWAPTLDVYVIDVMGRRIMPIHEDKPDNYRDICALWSPDGTMIAWCHFFTEGANKDPEYFGVAMARQTRSGSWAVGMQKERNAFVMPLAWSPRGEHVLCARIHRVPGRRGCRATLFLMDHRLRTVRTVCELDNWDWGQIGEVGRYADWARIPVDLPVRVSP